MAKAIGEGRWREYGREAVLQYCEEDVRASAELLRRQLAGYGSRAPVDPERVMHWSNYSAKTVARIQARGMPIDMRLWNLVQENKRAVIAALIRRFDPSQGEPRPDLLPGRRVEQRAVRALARERRHHRMAAPGLRRARTGRRRVPHDVRRPPGDRGAACAAREPRRHRARPDPDRPRRPQPAEPVSVRHRDRAQCAGQEPVQRPRRHALVHEVSAATRSGSISTGERRRSALRRRAAAMRRWRGLSVGRHLSRARDDVRPDQRHRHQALEGRPTRTSASK